MNQSLNDTDLQKCWIEYKAVPTQELRDRLMLHYLELVHYVAQRAQKRLVKSVDVDDLFSYGIFGLIDAIEKFDLDKGFKFETYATTRIRGAILDELRTQDWVPRSVRAFNRKLERAHAELSAELQRQPTDDEIARYMDIPLERLNLIYKNLAPSDVMASVNAMISSPSGETHEVEEFLLDHLHEDVSTGSELVAVNDRLAKLIDGLKPRERIIIILYYYDNLTLAEIGKILGVTESRVCQLHSRSIKTLYDKLTREIKE